MKTVLLLSLLAICALEASAAEMSEKEDIALTNRVLRDVAAGNLKSLSDLTALPPKSSTSAILTVAKLYSNDRAVFERCALLGTATPGNEDYLTKLLKSKPANNGIHFQQITAIKFLVFVRNQKSVRILCSFFENPEPAENGPRVITALSGFNLPGAPTLANAKIRFQDDFPKWKQWWADNSDNYSGDAPLPTRTN